MQYGKWIFLIIGALCIIMVAGFVGAPHLYYMAAILLTLPCVSYLLGWLALRQLEFSRESAASAWEGEEIAIHYRVCNPTRWPRYFLTIRETLPDWIEPVTQETPLFNAPAGDSVWVSQHICLHKRGMFAMKSIEVIAIDPLGVFAFTRYVSLPGELIVFPRVQALSDQIIFGAERYGLDECSSPLMRGSSVDPSGVRRYVVGDPLRRIHWRQTARTGQLSVIEFEESQARDLIIALDLKRDAYGVGGPESPLEYAVRFTASLAQEGLRQGANVRLALPDAGTWTEQDQLVFEYASKFARGQSQLFVLLSALARVEATSSEAIHTIVTHKLGFLPAGTTLFIVTGFPDPELPERLRGYASVGITIVVVLVDQSRFPNRESFKYSERLPAWFAELLSYGAQVLRLGWNKEGALQPDSVTEGNDTFHV